MRPPNTAHSRIKAAASETRQTAQSRAPASTPQVAQIGRAIFLGGSGCGNSSAGGIGEAVPSSLLEPLQAREHLASRRASALRGAQRTHNSSGSHGSGSGPGGALPVWDRRGAALLAPVQVPVRRASRGGHGRQRGRDLPTVPRLNLVGPQRGGGASGITSSSDEDSDSASVGSTASVRHTAHRPDQPLCAYDSAGARRRGMLMQI